MDATPAASPLARRLMCRLQFSSGELLHQSLDGSRRLGQRLHHVRGPRLAAMAGTASTLRQASARIDLVGPQLGLPDLVFTAAAAVELDGKALLAQFRHADRHREEPVFAATFRALQASRSSYSNRKCEPCA